MEERNGLVTALLRLDGMRERRQRDMYIDLLRQELQQHISFSRFDDERHDVFSLVNACIAQTGALHRLLSIVRGFHAGSLSMDSLDRLMEELLPEPLLEHRERLELHRLIAGIRCGGVASMYREAVGQLGPTLSVDARDLRAVVQELEDMNCPPGGIPPLVRFLEALAQQVGGEPASGLRQWTDTLLLRLRIPWQDAEALRSSVATPSTQEDAECDYAVIELQEDSVEMDRFLISVWLQRGSAPAETLHRDDDTYSLEELPNCVDLILSGTFDSAGDGHTGRVIEFVLPRRLLSHAVDQWTLRANRGFACRLGIEWPVVVRSLERLRDPSMHRHWRRKWEWFRTNQKLIGVEGAVYWIRSSTTKPEAFFAELIIDPKPVCLAFEEPPPVLQELGDDELAIGLHAGTPVMVWCRGGPALRRFKAEMSAQLDGRALVDLPEIVLRLRREAVRLDQAMDHLGLHITLLWDDPDRIPEPAAQLQAPT